MKDGNRVRVEGDGNRLGALGASPLNHGGEHGLMAFVHTVEVAKGRHARAVALWDLGEVGPTKHVRHSTNPRE
jgi:hypothetical protein